MAQSDRRTGQITTTNNPFIYPRNIAYWDKLEPMYRHTAKGLTPRGIALSLIGLVGLLVFYVLTEQLLNHVGILDLIRNRLELTSSRGIAAGIFWIILVIALLTPLSSASLLVIIGLTVFGPQLTFLLAYTAGGVAAFVSYQIGTRLRAVAPETWSTKIDEAQMLVRQWPNRMWLLIFLARAIPNPLYDVWGYAFGIIRVNLFLYIGASALGGIMPLGLICFYWANLR